MSIESLIKQTRGEKDPNIRTYSEVGDGHPSYNDQCFICDGSGYLVHHIDGNRDNNENSNLVKLCKSCHAQIHNGNDPRFNEWRDALSYVTVTSSIDKYVNSKLTERAKKEHRNKGDVIEDSIKEYVFRDSIRGYLNFKNVNVEIKISKGKDPIRMEECLEYVDEIKIFTRENGNVRSIHIIENNNEQ